MRGFVNPPMGVGRASPRSQSEASVASADMPSRPQVPRLGLSEARSLLLFSVALAGAAALGCTGLVACAGHLARVWRRPGATFAP